MTKIECIKMVLKYLRGLAQLWICTKIGEIFIKLNGNYPVILRRGIIKGTEDILNGLKAFGLHEEYEKVKQLYDEL